MLTMLTRMKYEVLLKLIVCESEEVERVDGERRSGRLLWELERWDWSCLLLFGMKRVVWRRRNEYGRDGMS